jgi:aminopeptidase YwaD
VADDGMETKAWSYLRWLTDRQPSRCVGTSGNREATDYVAGILSGLGLRVDRQAFDCIDWSQEGADLQIEGRPVAVNVSPYSLDCEVVGPLVVVHTLDQLEAARLEGKVVFLCGDIAREQLMPKNFQFYNPEHHARIVGLLEAKRPLAAVAATSEDAGMAGAVSPFPLFEDGDFLIPSVFLHERDCPNPDDLEGKRAQLEIRASRRPASGSNVVGRVGADRAPRLVCFAHVDAKDGTPGALDNASGVVILLLLAEMLQDYQGGLGLELVALNGEDYYAASGEVAYVENNRHRFGEIVLGVNIDGAGYRHGSTAYSLYGCPDWLADSVRAAFTRFPEMTEGEPWYQSDHGLFLMHERPALAITSADMPELWKRIAHTPRDVSELVDPAKLVTVASALRCLFSQVSEASSSDGEASPWSPPETTTPS